MVDEVTAESRSLAQSIGLWLGFGLFLIVLLFFDLEPGKPVVTRMAAVAVLMAVWWITDAIPLFATALLPMILYPLLGILSTKATAPIYVNSTIFLFLGGFIIALAMEHWNLHGRRGLFVHVDIKHRHGHHDAAHRHGHHLEDGVRIRRGGNP